MAAWGPYLPLIASIYLILIAPIAAMYLDRMVEQLDPEQWVENQKKLIKNIAKDWATRIGFINAVVAAFISLFVIFEKKPGLAIGSAILFVAVTLPIGLWIVSHTTIGALMKPRREGVTLKIPFIEQSWELPKTKNKTPAQLCDVVLIVMNLVLIGLTWYSRQ